MNSMWREGQNDSLSLLDEMISTSYGLPQSFDCLAVLWKAEGETWGAH